MSKLYCLILALNLYSSGPIAGKKKKDISMKHTVASALQDNVSEVGRSSVEDVGECKDNCTGCQCDAKGVIRTTELVSGETHQKSGQTCSCLCNNGSENMCPKRLKLESVSALCETERNSAGVFSSAVINSPLNKAGGTEQVTPKLSKGCGSEQISSKTDKGLGTSRQDQSLQKMGAKKNCTTELNAIADGENAMFPDSMEKLKVTETEVEGMDICAIRSPSSIGSQNDLPEDHDTDGKLVPMSVISSQKEVETVFKTMLEKGWNSKECSDVTIAELYLMCGANGELKFEYEWVNLKKETELLQEKLLMSLNNMLRRLSHLAMMEITEFSKVCVKFISSEMEQGCC